MGEEGKDGLLDSVHSTVFKQSESLEGKSIIIEGYDFKQGVNYPQLIKSFASTGFQASNLAHAIQVINQMLDWSLADEPIGEYCNEEEKDMVYRKSVKCKVFLGVTADVISSGVRDSIRYLAQHHMVDVIVTTAGCIEEDLIKCLLPTCKRDFSLPVADLRSKGLSRIGNLLVSNDKYRKFEDWIIPIYHQMLREQNKEHVTWTPSKLIARLGREINNESSYLYWAYVNNIPVFCPGLTDGSLWNMLFFRSPGLRVEVVQDCEAIGIEAFHASPRNTGMISLGGGIPKNDICIANMIGNSADYAVFINTAQEFDRSDSGARADEAVSCGKICGSAKTVKVHCDATIAFPLVVAETFATRNGLLASVHSTVFKHSENLEGKSIKIEGYNFNQGVNYPQLLKSFLSTGFQASNLGASIQVINQMLDWSLADEPIAEDCNEEEKDLAYRKSVRCKVFLGFTSNLISSGVRDTVRYLTQHHMVDVIVTTTGGIEEDLIKCLAPTYKGDFSLPGADLRSKGLNRIGNLLVPNDNYCKFEDWIIPIFDQMLREQNEEHVTWTPSKLIARLGREINNESSYLYWAYVNNIPVFCPGLTDGSLGDMLYFHSFRCPGLIVDVVQDIRSINSEAVHASPRKTGMIILGGGVPKHHICNANMMRNGADYAVFINTAQEFDGSDSGAHPDEAVSWGKICGSAKTVKVHCDATIAFPLVVAETFATRGKPC